MQKKQNDKRQGHLKKVIKPQINCSFKIKQPWQINWKYPNTFVLLIWISISVSATKLNKPNCETSRVQKIHTHPKSPQFRRYK